MEKYYILSTSGEKLVPKMEVIGHTSKPSTEEEAKKIIESGSGDTLIVLNSRIESKWQNH